MTDAKPSVRSKRVSTWVFFVCLCLFLLLFYFLRPVDHTGQL